MEQDKKSSIWKIRTVKNYHQAHNHLFIGQVIQQTQSYVRIKCRTFHFSRVVNSLKDVKTGHVGVRILPWTSIEFINELPETFDYINAQVVFNEDGKASLRHDDVDCVLCSSYDRGI